MGTGSMNLRPMHHSGELCCWCHLAEEPNLELEKKWRLLRRVRAPMAWPLYHKALRYQRDGQAISPQMIGDDIDARNGAARRGHPPARRRLKANVFTRILLCLYGEQRGATFHRAGGVDPLRAGSVHLSDELLGPHRDRALLVCAPASRWPQSARAYSRTVRVRVPAVSPAPARARAGRLFCRARQDFKRCVAKGLRAKAIEKCRSGRPSG